MVSNYNVNAVISSKIINLDLTLNSFSGDESSSIVKSSVGATQGWCYCETTTGQNDCENFVTEHVLDMNIFEHCKPPKACPLALNFAQIIRGQD